MFFCQACKFLDESWCPKFVVIIAQKNHHTKFFQPQSPDNVPPGRATLNSKQNLSLFNLWYLHFIVGFEGTIIDNRICHPKNNDFYLCAQAGMIVSIKYMLLFMVQCFFACPMCLYLLWIACSLLVLPSQVCIKVTPVIDALICDWFIVVSCCIRLITYFSYYTCHYGIVAVYIFALQFTIVALCHSVCVCFFF